VALTYRFLEQDDLLVTVGDGAISAEDLTSFARQQISDPHWPFGKRRLADMRTVISQLQVEDAETAASIYGDAFPTLRGSRQAIVAAKHWDQAEAFEDRIDTFGMKTIVFSSLHTACAWLGIDIERTLLVVDDLRRQLRTTSNAPNADTSTA
jgi:hypothetical protein